MREGSPLSCLLFYGILPRVPLTKGAYGNVSKDSRYVKCKKHAKPVYYDSLNPLTPYTVADSGDKDKSTRLQPVCLLVGIIYVETMADRFGAGGIGCGKRCRLSHPRYLYRGGGYGRAATQCGEYRAAGNRNGAGSGTGGWQPEGTECG